MSERASHARNVRAVMQLLQRGPLKPKERKAAVELLCDVQKYLDEEDAAFRRFYLPLPTDDLWGRPCD